MQNKHPTVGLTIGCGGGGARFAFYRAYTWRWMDVQLRFGVVGFGLLQAQKIFDQVGELFIGEFVRIAVKSILVCVD